MKKIIFNLFTLISIMILFYLVFDLKNTDRLTENTDKLTENTDKLTKEHTEKNIREKKLTSLLNDKAFYLIESSELKILNEKFQLLSYYLPFIEYHENKTKPVAYVGYVDAKTFKRNKHQIIIVSGYGETIGLNLDINESLNEKSFKNLREDKWFKIDNNLKDISNFQTLMESNRYGVKDILVDGEYLYVVIAEIDLNQNDKCKTIKIYRSKLGDSQLGDGGLNFNLFFNNEECTDGYNPHAAGGRLVKYSENELILSTGDWLNEKKISQDDGNIYGKIIKINIDNPNDFIMISKGHRNPQGLFYDKESNILFSTEHGPTGGDEVNFINLNNNDKKNYGWPIASYGEPKDKNILYLKTHIEGGFIEPIKYFKQKYLGISNIIKIPNNFFTNQANENKIYLLSFLKGRQFISLLFDKNYKLINSAGLGESFDKEYISTVGTRVRDLIFIDNNNSIVFIGEDEPSINFIIRK